ncbi:Uncharacterised protein [Serratia entomophila]|uniref:hypothetical protein n=1 Tax=Serratia entomophila TaxID=42906 RepID=UPI002179C981|nr:hypothetical protein [Serratia entomophila]CAI1096001.1 Uncharacterised protein [Serratia entomophila]CAI1115308.1 Uncharacterised protein [Serratia entomophila]CAI2138539.1 Uncharacterised protein [Serratia entomophila]
MDAKAIAVGLLKGIESIPEGITLSARRTWEGSGLAGSQLKLRNQSETERFFRVIKLGYGIENPLRELIGIIINDCYKRMDQQTQNKISQKLNHAEGFTSGRILTQGMVTMLITQSILKKVAGSFLFRRIVQVGTFFSLNTIMLQGLIEQAAVASRNLREKYPATYHKLTPRNLDILYFLAEEYLAPFVAYANSNSDMFCKGINHELSKILGQ